MPQNGQPYIPYLGRYSTVAALTTARPPGLTKPPLFAYTGDQGLVYSNGVSWVTVGGGGSLPASAASWTKVGAAIPYTALATAALVNSIALFNLPAGGVISGIKVKHSASFAGGAITAYSLSVGVANALDKYGGPFDVFQAPSTTTYELDSNLGGEDQSSVTSILLTATSVGANLNAATAGTVDIWALISVAA